MRNRSIFLGFVSMVAASLGVVFSLGMNDKPANSGGFRPVASVRGLMAGQEILYSRINERLVGPPAPARTKMIQLLSESLAEMANVNTLNSDKEDYRNWASELRATAMELAGEAKKHDKAEDSRMKSLMQKIEATCKACHDAYQ